MNLWSLILLAGIAAAMFLASRQLIHWFQIESYQFPGYFRTILRNVIKALIPGILLTILLIAAMILFAGIGNDDQQLLRQVLVAAAMVAGGTGIHFFLKTRKMKKPLVYTARVKRLCAVTLAVYFGLLVLAVAIAGAQENKDWLMAVTAVPLLLPVWFALAGLIAWPIEKGISELYFRDARKKLLSRNDLIRIGITGSWGKTSVKFILGTLLQEKYNTLVTPASFNTPMGVTKVIRTMLEPGHRVFVAEMGARHVGDIKEMCRLVRPQYGILTSVGPQHLDTFKTVERIKKTKYELMDAIPEEGACFFGDDAGICRELFTDTGKEKYLAGTEAFIDDVWAENITVTPNGSEFELCTKEERCLCGTRLLGELNIRNITLAASVCLKLGLTMKQISRGISKLQPVEHRLQLIPRPDGITVIDDAFNSNIRGAKTALNVLKQFPGRRIVVTPGMVELGSEEERLNREIGETAAECTDIAILVGGKHTAPIAEGIRSKGYDEKNILTVRSLDEAAQWINTNGRAGDIILFENDLPDNYSE